MPPTPHPAPASTADEPTAASTARLPRPLLLRYGIFEPRSLVRFAVACAILATVWTLLGLLLVTLGTPAVDLAVLDLARSLQSPELVPIARFVSWLGDFPVVLAATVVVASIAYRRVRRWDLGWLTLAVIGGALAITAAAKGLSDRPRPDGGLTDTFSSAFPSGHAVRAAAVYALVAWLVLRWTSRHRRVTRALAVTLAVTMILAIGASRMLLGDHWLTDVLGGYVLGIGWFAVCVWVTQPHRAPREPATTIPATATRDG
jgi:membrane-associated phospholipid phosphatase